MLFLGIAVFFAADTDDRKKILDRKSKAAEKGKGKFSEAEVATA